MWMYVSGKDKEVDKWTLDRMYNVEYQLGNGKTSTLSNKLTNIDDKYYWFLSEGNGLDIIQKDRIVTMVCMSNTIKETATVVQ